MEAVKNNLTRQFSNFCTIAKQEISFLSENDLYDYVIGFGAAICINALKISNWYMLAAAAGAAAYTRSNVLIKKNISQYFSKYEKNSNARTIAKIAPIVFAVAVYKEISALSLKVTLITLAAAVLTDIALKTAHNHYTKKASE